MLVLSQPFKSLQLLMEVDGEGVLVGVVVIGLCNTPPSIYHSQQEINSRGGDP